MKRSLIVLVLLIVGGVTFATINGYIIFKEGENISGVKDQSLKSAVKTAVSDETQKDTTKVVAVDYETADFEVLTELAKTDGYDAEQALAERFYLDKSFEELLEMAEQGHATAQLKIGGKYFAGEEIEHDLIKAEKWYLKAAEQDHSSAQNALSFLYRHGGMHMDGRGVKKDAKKALELQVKSADQGNSFALNGLAWRYMVGDSVEQDMDKVLELFASAVEKGDVMAAHTLAGMYFEGQQIPKDNKKAIFWYEKAVEMGDKYAQQRINEIKGIKDTSQPKSKSIQLTKPLDREDFLELFDMSEYIKNEKRECTRAGYSETACMCDLKEEYWEISAFMKEVVERHPDWIGSALSYKGERVHHGSGPMKGKLVGTGISTSLKVMQNSIDRFEKKACSKE